MWGCGTELRSKDARYAGLFPAFFLCGQQRRVLQSKARVRARGENNGRFGTGFQTIGMAAKTAPRTQRVPDKKGSVLACPACCGGKSVTPPWWPLVLSKRLGEKKNAIFCWPGSCKPVSIWLCIKKGGHGEEVVRQCPVQGRRACASVCVAAVPCSQSGGSPGARCAGAMDNRAARCCGVGMRTAV